MKMNSFDAVIFDLGGVIINLDYQKTISAFHELGMTNFEQVYSQMAQSDLFDSYETGKISTQHFINLLLPHLPFGTSPNKVVAAWNAMILDVPLKKIALLADLKKSLPTFLLSNTNDLHIQKVRDEWKKVTDSAMEESFHKMYLSHEIKHRKPTSQAFSYVLEENGLEAARTIFIDDTLQHIVGAKSIGLQTLHLTNPEFLYEFFS
ncbi:MAG: HAD family phosphatase [Crocinitomicaceae bacterium]|nr:HAD family phosphatase [Crocinitomicaceae bacterium]